MALKLKVLLCVLLFVLLKNPYFSKGQEFYYTKFSPTPDNITTNGTAYVMSDGLLRLNNAEPKVVGHALYPSPIRVKSSPNGEALSFSTVFAFRFVPQLPENNFGHGFAFAFVPNKDLLAGAFPSQFLGLLNSSNNGNFTNHLFAVEFDEVQDLEFHDINDNHIGINLNSMISSNSVAISDPNLALKSRNIIMAWIDYDSGIKQLNVSLSISDKKPHKSLLSYDVDLSPYLKEFMYVGFSASTGQHSSTLHFIKCWSFKVNGQARALHPFPKEKKPKFAMILGASLASVVLFFLVLGLVIYSIWWYKNRDVIESWELDVGPHRFPYHELKEATNDFDKEQIIGFGGFGRVYKGTFPNSNTQVAVKTIFNDSRQGLQEFLAEISSIGRLRHRNLVQLLGWCRRREALILVYDYMPNGSLDKYLFDDTPMVLSWDQRFNIIKGVAAGLLYLHEGWEQTVIHRDIKAGNVLLDTELNAKLGDFGLAKLYEHGVNPSTTRVMGTVGYLAPDLIRTGKPTMSSDVFAFGALMLEVACGRRPINPKALPEELILVDWVWDRWNDGSILHSMDPKLKDEYNEIEAVMVLKLGLMCSVESPDARPTMKQVVRYLEGEMVLPEMVEVPGGYKGKKRESSRQGNDGAGEIEEYLHSYPSATCMDVEGCSDSILSVSGGT